MRFGTTISRYLIGAILPYFIFSWLLLSVILFVQQAGRFSDIFFSANIPATLIWQLTLALVPSVIAFTCPMAVLVGVIIGLAKMQGDSELVAIRAAGVGTLQITIPVIILGILLSMFAFFINLYGVPFAARVVRQVALRTAIHKLESPIEPGVFNTEIAGYTIYVKDGDVDNGQWNNIFVHHEDERSGTIRLVTSSNGRIDSSDELSELVLENAVGTTFNRDPKQRKYVSERLGDVRFAIMTRRTELLQKLTHAELTPEELGLGELSEYAERKEGRDRIEAQILWQRRIILSITPLIFCLLGTTLMLRFGRRGRGAAVLIALGSLIAYFLLAFLGEQLARTERLAVVEGGLLPLIASFAVIAWFSLSSRFVFFGRLGHLLREGVAALNLRLSRFIRPNFFVDLTAGLRDFDIVVSILKYYVLTVFFLAAVFLIFTAFELWKFAGTFEGGPPMLGQYLLFVMPFIYTQLAPSAAMIAVLATYVIKSRQNEIVVWASSGQSVYRLLFPCMVLMLVLGAINWQVQERIAPATNLRQTELRTLIRARGVVTNKTGRSWLASDQRIYSWRTEESNNTSASDNATRLFQSDGVARPIRDLIVFDLSDNYQLQAVYRAEMALWQEGRIEFPGGAQYITLGDSGVNNERTVTEPLKEEVNPFGRIISKPSYLTIAELKQALERTDAEVERRSYGVALEKKYTTFFLPFVIALFTAPFALSLNRKGKVVTVGYAVGLSLAFIGVTSIFEQLGLGGYLSASIAVWAPLIIFSLLGIFLLSRVKT